nr:MAG TPA: hypothetical protein [Bacteriophage sp.]
MSLVNRQNKVTYQVLQVLLLRTTLNVFVVLVVD